MTRPETVKGYMQKPVEELLQICREQFDRRLAAEVCRELNFGFLSNYVNDAHSLEEFTRFFREMENRQIFMANYVAHLEAKRIKN